VQVVMTGRPAADGRPRLSPWRHCGPGRARPPGRCHGRGRGDKERVLDRVAWARIWVQLTGPLRPLQIRAGDGSISPAPSSAIRPPTRRGPDCAAATPRWWHVRKHTWRWAPRGSRYSTDGTEIAGRDHRTPARAVADGRQRDEHPVRSD